jgi:hypothetical protein
MALSQFNSIQGFSVGNTSVEVINSDGNIISSQANIGNIEMSGAISNLGYIDFDTTGTLTPDIAGRVSWNQAYGTLEIGMNDVTQQVGLEQYYPPVKNNTANTITNGTVVAFAGAETNGISTIVIEPYIADGSSLPIYLMGVATEDIEANSLGYVTTFGIVRDLNTTGNIYSETWTQGQILYASPTVAGGFTNLRPTSPDDVVPVAAVLKVDGTDGEILVRPTIEQKLAYGSFYSNATQDFTSANTAYGITYNNTIDSYAVDIGTPASRIVCINSGLYQFDFSIQINNTGGGTANVYVWSRVDGTDVVDLGSKTTITDKNATQVLSWGFQLSMTSGQYFELMAASTATTTQALAEAATGFSPAVASSILKVTQVAL